jgi:hypothetical protein
MDFPRRRKVSDLPDLAYSKRPFIVEQASDRFILHSMHPSNAMVLAPFRRTFTFWERLGWILHLLCQTFSQRILKGVEQ